MIFPSGNKDGPPKSADVINLPKDCRRAAVLRSIFGATALCCSFSSLMYLPISKSNVLFFTGPLYVPVLAYYILDEKISRVDILALVLGFFGTIFINNPFSETARGANETLGVILSLAGGIASSVAWVYIRKMSSGCHFTIGPFYFSLGCTVIGAIIFMFSVQGETNDVRYDLIGITLIVTISLVTFVGQLLQALAYQYEKTSRVAVFYYFQTFLVFTYDYFIFGTQLGVIEFFGALLIIGCNFIVASLKFFGVIK